MFYNCKIKSKKKANFLLIVPFFLIAIFLIIVPMTMVLVQSFLPTSSGGVDLNWSYLDGFIWGKILKSFLIAILSTIICVLISYPFAYFLAGSSSQTFKCLVIFVVTAPIWTSFLVKLVGLKTFFDVMNGFSNSTYGDIFTVIGLSYIYIPFMIMPLYTCLNEMPKNLVFASKDLGYNGVQTFFKIVLPYTKLALISGIAMVFLPCVTTVAVPQFLNNSVNGSTIGDIIVQEGEQALTSQIALARASTLSLVVGILMLVVYFFIRFFPKFLSKSIKKIRTWGAENE